jgi:hypothetical protein
MPSAGATLAEGMAGKSAGMLTSRIVQALVDNKVLVSEGNIEHAFELLLQIEKTVVGGAGLPAEHRPRSGGGRAALACSTQANLPILRPGQRALRRWSPWLC